jgi:hypothetical protein
MQLSSPSILPFSPTNQASEFPVPEFPTSTETMNPSNDQMENNNGNALERFKPDFFRFFLTAAVLYASLHAKCIISLHVSNNEKNQNGRSDAKHL